MKVIPVINVDEGDEAELMRRVDLVRKHTDRLHIDISDGTFAPTHTFRNAARIRELVGNLKIQAHLMVAEPEKIIEAWLDAGADEIVVHLEPLLGDENAEPAVLRLAKLREACLKRDAKLVIAGGPALESRALLAHRAYADGFLVLAVNPGPRGQEMQVAALDVVRVIRDTFPDDVIWVDGGVNQDTLADVRAAGTTAAVSGAPFNAEDPVAALAALQ